MSVLAALNSAYDRMADRGEAPPFGYSMQNIHGCIEIDTTGEVSGPPISFGMDKYQKLAVRRLAVPYFGGRSGSKAPPYFLWDNSSYVLGISTKDDFDPKPRHADFKESHYKYLSGIEDKGLNALVLFLTKWDPEHFDVRAWSQEFKDRNFVFKLKGDDCFLHDRPAAQEAWSKAFVPDTMGVGICLVTGRNDQIARLHPPIMGFENPARIVSFDRNSDAFASYGHVQGNNAPTGLSAAFGYTTALNAFLQRDSGHCLQIGDASTVFWAETADQDEARDAENFFLSSVGSSEKTEQIQSDAIRTVLEKIAVGRPMAEVKPSLREGVRFYILGLSPNVARLSVRFWVEDDFGVIAQNLIQHFLDLAMAVRKDQKAPSVRTLLIATVQHRASEGPNGTVWRPAPKAKILPFLAGETMRAVLTGGRYPLTLLSSVIGRVRAERGNVTRMRAAICRAVINRNRRLSNKQEDIPVALDRANIHPAYRLGRLFALLESAQLLAFDRNINATIRDRYFSSASTTPLRVYPFLVKNAMNHLSKAQKTPKTKKLAHWVEKQMGEVWSEIEPVLPRLLTLEDQGRFQVGYYHQRFAKKDKAGEENLVAELEPEISDEADIEEDSN